MAKLIQSCILGSDVSCEQQDQMLLSWLQSTLSRSFLSCIIGCIHSCQLWVKAHDYFHKQTRARVQQLLTKLCSMTLDDRSMGDFLKIKSLVDCLVSIEDPTFL
ncbi:hypothetical protein V8G54_008156 [Vigna mungo]|uniref:Uncharacterized protein n=1 Tax=Vigna mungo TaxID=3915 RepID=A0AAQ3P2Z6_VIGMU